MVVSSLLARGWRTTIFLISADTANLTFDIFLFFVLPFVNNSGINTMRLFLISIYRRREKWSHAFHSTLKITRVSICRSNWRKWTLTYPNNERKQYLSTILESIGFVQRDRINGREGKKQIRVGCRARPLYSCNRDTLFNQSQKPSLSEDIFTCMQYLYSTTLVS